MTRRRTFQRKVEYTLENAHPNRSFTRYNVQETITEVDDFTLEILVETWGYREGGHFMQPSTLEFEYEDEYGDTRFPPFDLFTRACDLRIKRGFKEIT